MPRELYYGQLVSATLSPSLSTFHGSSGKCLLAAKATNVSEIMIQYTSRPPARFLSTESAKSDVVQAGPTARMKDVAVCARPFVAPKDSCDGEDAVTNIDAQAS
jgi:hypothetical protein